MSGSLEYPSVWVVTNALISDPCHCALGMEYLESFRWHLIGDEVESCVTVLEEKRHLLKAIEPVLNRVILYHLLPDLLLLATS